MIDNRAASEVNLVGKKNSLKAAAMNSVAFKFVTKARLDVKAQIDEDALMELCLEHGTIVGALAAVRHFSTEAQYLFADDVI